MFDGRFRTPIEKAVRPVGIALKRTGLSADHLTILGILFAIALTIAISADNPGVLRFQLPVTQLVVIVVVASLAGVAAALLPAWRASRMDVLEAVSST